ncbi:epoxide hydrolase family protein [Nocardioides sp. NPDC101246]|uniref:epoxide hydrolase family protein n=1 Tax=Nocardioides sp. NPDC101246 TaxID=3364336 RepID=UPI003804CB72
MLGGDDVLPFEVDVEDDVLTDLRRRLKHTRWPDQIPGSGWERGTDGGYLRTLIDYWHDDFDWRAQERTQNAWPQFVTTLDGARVHFFHVRSPHPQARPLMLTHGWPSTPLEFLGVIGPLTDPTAYGGRAEDACHVVAPSMPGFGWSLPTAESGWHAGRIASAWLELMRRLGYERFVSHGTDWGSVVSTEMARQAPERVAGLHLTLLISGLRPADGVLTPEEEVQQQANDALRGTELGYVMLQSTKPQTLAHALADSPVGQAAWIVEKLRGWTDCDGDLESVLSKDEILTSVTTFWVTGTGGSSGRLYYEGRVAAVDSVPRPGRIEVPTAVALFPKELYPTSRRIASEHYDIVRWTPMARGGHFGAWEQPDLLVTDLRAFLRGL